MPKKTLKSEKKNCDYIDSSVFLGYIFEQGNECKEYLNVMGYKSHNDGLISHFVMSEILINLILKVKLDDPIRERVVKDKAFRLLDETIVKLKEECKLKILKLTKRNVDNEIFEDLKKIDHMLTDDDTYHLVVAIVEKCQFFVTTDRELIENKKLREHLSRDYNLKIREIKLE